MHCFNARQPPPVAPKMSRKRDRETNLCYQPNHLKLFAQRSRSPHPPFRGPSVGCTYGITRPSNLRTAFLSTRLVRYTGGPPIRKSSLFEGTLTKIQLVSAGLSRFQPISSQTLHFPDTVPCKILFGRAVISFYDRASLNKPRFYTNYEKRRKIPAFQSLTGTISVI